MTSRSIVIAIAAGLLATPAVVHSQTSLSIAGGVNAPVGNLGNSADLGYTVSAALNVGGTALPVGLRFEGAYNALGLKNTSGDIRIISATANAVFNLGKTADAPYFIAGLGAYNRRLTLDPFRSAGDRTVVGINGGAGLRFPLSGIATFVEARYHIMLGKSNDATNYQFIPITFGIMF